MSALRVGALVLLVAACGTPAAGDNAGGAADAATIDAAPDGALAPDAPPGCPFPAMDGRQDWQLHVTLANMERSLLHVEAVALSGGSICLARQPPAADTIAIFEPLPTAIYELRFTAAGYIPLTCTLDPAHGDTCGRDPIVMVRGTSLGPATPSTAPLTPFHPARWGVRPGTDDLFYAGLPNWQVVRRSGSTLTVSEIDVPSPTTDGLVEAPTFTPDGEVVFLSTGPPGSFALTCVAVSAATGTVIARDLPLGICTDMGRARFAASARFGLASDAAADARFVFSWTSTSYDEEARLPLATTSLLDGQLDAAGAHLWGTDDHSHPLIYDWRTATSALTAQAVDDFTRVLRGRSLGASGTYLLHVDGGDVNRTTCDARGCDIVLEPLSGPVVPVVTGAPSWAASPIADVVVYTTNSGELHRYDAASRTDTVAAVDAFETVYTFEDTLVLTGPSGVQLYEMSTGVVRLDVPGTFTFDPDPRPGIGGGTPVRYVIFTDAACTEPADCAAQVVDLHAFTTTPTHDHPYAFGTRAWFRDAALLYATGDASQATGRWSFFAGPDATMDPVASEPPSVTFPCVPQRFRGEWVCTY